MIYVLLVAWLLKVILVHAVRFFLLLCSRLGTWGAAFGHRSSVAPEQPIWQSMCLENWASRDTTVNLAQCLLFAGCPWMFQMWVRERQGRRFVFVEHCFPFSLLPFDFVLLFTHWLWCVAFAWLKVQACGPEAAGWEECVHPHGQWGVLSSAAQAAVSWLQDGYKWSWRLWCVVPMSFRRVQVAWPDRATDAASRIIGLRHCWWDGSQPAIQGGKNLWTLSRAGPEEQVRNFLAWLARVFL